MGINYSTDFHRYLLDQSEYLNHLKELREGCQSYDRNDPLYERNGIDKIIDTMTPKEGEPFAFFKWFYAGGFKIYEEYFERHPEANKNYEDEYGKPLWTYALNEEKLKWTKTDNEGGKIEEFTIGQDIQSLFGIELRKSLQIFRNIWNTEASKLHFRNTFQEHINHFKLVTNLEPLTSSSIHTHIIIISRAIYFQVFERIIKPFKKLLVEYPDVPALVFIYPKEDDFYDANDPNSSFRFSIEPYTRPKEIFELLSKKNFIASDSATEYNFSRAFNGRTISPENKVMWLRYGGSGPFSIIYFFIKQLIKDKGLIAPVNLNIQDTNRIINTRIRQLFTYENNKSIYIPSKSALHQLMHRKDQSFTALDREILTVLSQLS